MKKKYSFLGRHLKPLAIAVALACPQLMMAQVEINDTNFPDDVFRDYVTNNWDTNPQDGTLSKTEISSVTAAWLGSQGIEDFTGIENFTYLTELYVSGNGGLEKLDVSALTRLTSLDASNCALTEINIAGLTKLKTINLNNNQLEALDFTGLEKLESIDCNENRDLTSINVTGLTKLKSISAYGCPLTKVDVSGLESLESLSVNDNNDLEEINATGCKNLTYVSYSTESVKSLIFEGCVKLTNSYYGYMSELTTLNLKGITGLTDLNVYSNPALTNLDVSGCTKLTSLSVYSNESLTAIDVSGLTALTTLRVYENNLTSIDVTGLTALTELLANQNNLSSIDVSGLTKLETLYVYENETLSEIKGLKDLATLTTLEAYKTALTSIDVSGLTKLVRLNVSECEYLEEIDASGCTALTDVSNLNSYDSFKALKKINLSGTGISSFWIASEDIESIDLSGCTALTSVNISGKEKLTSLDVSGCTAMTSFDVYDCATLTSVNLNGCSALTSVSLYRCATLTTVDLTGLSKVEYLSCYQNESLTSLDVSSLAALTQLYAYENKLAALDLSNNKKLTYIDVNNNQLATLTLNNPVLETLNCEKNLLTALDVSNSTGLTWLNCSDNQLTTLDVSKNIHLNNLDCENNQLTSLDLSNNTELGWWSNRQQRTIDLVTLSSNEVGFMVDDTFDSENVSSLYVDYSEIEPKYVTVYGKRYFVVYNDASKATDLKEKPISYYYKTSKDGWDLEIALTINDIVKSETIIEMEENVSLKATFGEELVAPAVTVREGYDGKISYNSSDANVVKVAADGKLTVVGAGKAVITISGTETNYCLAPADVTYDVEIEKASIKPVVTLEGWTYSEKAKTPVVKDNLGKGKETYTYKVKGAADDTYSATVPTDAGDYTVKVVVAETNNYLGGEATADFTIAAKALTEKMVGDVEDMVYTGSAIEPKPEIMDGKKTLVEGTDYTLTYSANTEPGTATITITGKGNYQGTVTTQFTIKVEGDANGDDKVDVSDIDTVIEHVNEEVTDANKAADVNGDGQIDVADIDYIIERIKG